MNKVRYDTWKNIQLGLIIFIGMVALQEPFRIWTYVIYFLGLGFTAFSMEMAQRK